MILLIDSYDSFTNNLSKLIELSTGKQIIVIHNDTFEPGTYETFIQQYIDLIEYIVIGPGPGLPMIEGDVGIINWIFDFFNKNPEKSIPILGICLGFQCLCYCFGNSVQKLTNVKHGQVYDVIPLQNDELFNNMNNSIPSVRYHSLFVDITQLNDNIVPLAICYDDDKQVLMAGKHKSLPFYGVQYHPESICTEKGSLLVKNFDDIATKYNVKTRKIKSINDNNTLVEGLRLNVEDKPLSDQIYQDNGANLHVYARKLHFDPGIQVIDICEHLIQENGYPNFVLLNSASTPGEWSIIGLPIVGRSDIITHSIDIPDIVKLLKYGSSDTSNVNLEGLVWNFIAKEFAKKLIFKNTILSKIKEYPEDIPFLGGYVGLISYEEGQHILVDDLGQICNNETPDLKLIFIERFLLFNMNSKEWWYFSVNIIEDDSVWSEQFLANIQRCKQYTPQSQESVKALTADEIKFKLPDQDIYRQQFEQCQDLLHSGDSYELCLTTPLKIFLPSGVKPWDIYKVLLTRNPSPFSCFVDFKDVVLISSSPERFLRWKGDESTKNVELKPIKGTVKNTSEINLAKATEILKTPKEMGENLMIVDLIRHDLHRFIDQVKVPELMVVEKYKTVYQLVSTITGNIDNQTRYHGLDILYASLPPGSMTGAPKKRSVELLQKIEQLQPNAIKGGRRGVYSGVMGYWSITDEADWSVIIRSAYHYQDDKENTKDYKLWRIGAGGAITVLSDLQGEWDEMHLKLISALQAFK